MFSKLYADIRLLTSLFISYFLIKSCESQLLCSVIHELFQEGFHRTYCSYVTFQYVLPVECTVAFRQTLPPGMYIDTFQIASQESFGGPKVCTQEAIDVEKSSDHSQSHIINVFNTTTHHDNSSSTNVCFPIHLRYHKPVQTGKELISLANPVVLTSCPVKVNEQHTTEDGPCPFDCSLMCQWHRLNCNYVRKDIIVSVPVGLPSHWLIVATCTITVSIIAVLLLLKTMWSSYSRFQKKLV